MIIYNFEKYNFKNCVVEAITTTINFSLENDIEIILHEETQGKYEQIRDLETVKAFPPLVFSVDIELNLIKKSDFPKKIEKLILLDGHHRYEHLALYNYDYPVPIVLISNQHVEIQSYNSKINGDEEQFIELLLKNNFIPSTSIGYCINFKGTTYSCQDIKNIYELYDFKRKLINSDLISAVRNDTLDINDMIVDFTPIKINEFYRENYLFPPKSTWISPRI